MKTTKTESTTASTAATTPPAEASGIAVHCAFDALVDVANLTANPRNPNRHGDKQVALLAKIIRHQGWRAPIVVSKRSGFVVAGHGRLEAAKLLGVDVVPVSNQAFATEADEWAHLVADNRIAELSDMNLKGVAAILEDLKGLSIDLDVSGFDRKSMAELLIGLEASEPDEGVDAGEPKASDTGYSLFEIVMLHENKKRLTDAINKAKMRHSCDTNEAALMEIIKDFSRAQ